MYMQLKKFLQGLDSVSEWSGRVFVWLIVPLTALVVFEVISRRIFNVPHIWATEVTDFIYGPHFMLVAAYTLLYRSHVSIEVIYERFSPKVRAILDCFTYLVFFFPFCIIVFTNGILFAYTSWSIGETSESAALIVLPGVKTVIPVAFLLIFIQGLANFIRRVAFVVKGKEI
jgi:TRAP-type mannitol/chloroaromatic compound transport system permease small subunit